MLCLICYICTYVYIIYVYHLWPALAKKSSPKIGLPGNGSSSNWNLLQGKKRKETRISCGVKCWKKTSTEAKQRTVDQHVVSFNKTLCWINMLFSIRQFFFQFLTNMKFLVFPVLVIFRKVVIFLTAAPDSTRKVRLFPGTTLLTDHRRQATKSIDPNSCDTNRFLAVPKKLGEFFSKMPTFMKSWSQLVGQKPLGTQIQDMKGWSYCIYFDPQKLPFFWGWILMNFAAYYCFWPCYLLGCWWNLHRLDFSRFCGNHPQLLGARLRGFILGV